MKNSIIGFLTLLCMFSISCNQKTKKVGDRKDAEVEQKTEPAVMADGHNSKNSLDWSGTYRGTLPCASCEGIKISLTLFESGKYDRTVTYLGKEKRGTTDNGDFEWNDSGSIINVKDKDGSEQLYQVGESLLFHLDKKGNRIQGDLAEMYLLKKNPIDPKLEDKKWKLFEIMGQEVVIEEGTKEASITFHSILGQATGNNSCNAFACSYDLKTGNRISLGNAAATLMACKNMALASKFNGLFQQVDNYAISEDGILSLNKARMAPLARFKMVAQE